LLRTRALCERTDTESWPFAVFPSIPGRGYQEPSLQDLPDDPKRATATEYSSASNSPRGASHEKIADPMVSEPEPSRRKSGKGPMARRFQYEGTIWKVEAAGTAADPAGDKTSGVRFTCLLGET
jgi:hypothetical protein